MGNLFRFKEYEPELVDREIDFRSILYRFLLVSAIFVSPIVWFLVWYTVKTLPVYGYIFGGLVTAYAPLFMLRKMSGPKVKLTQDYKVNFENRASINERLLHRSLASVGIFVIHSVLWMLVLGDMIRR